MAKFCLKCYEVFKIESLLPDKVNNFQHCPKISCTGQVIDVDELMLPIIIELNKKGYYTEYCCAGHYYDKAPNSYIRFEEGIELPLLPSGYEYECSNPITIRNDFSQYVDGEICYLDHDKYFEIINNNASQLLDWANALPINEFRRVSKCQITQNVQY